MIIVLIDDDLALDNQYLLQSISSSSIDFVILFAALANIVVNARAFAV